MKPKYTALLLITAAALIITGCGTLPPITGTYTEGGLAIAYADACAECSVTAPLDQQERLRSESQSQQALLLPAAGIAIGLTAVDPRAYNGWHGDCPGCDIDAWFFSAMLAAHDIPCATLYNSQATAAGIIAAATAAVRTIQPGGLLIIYISGHGAQQRDTSGDEADRMDEQLCLWDGRMTDDTVWQLLSRVPPTIRIFMVSDTCHAGTNFRGPVAIAPALLQARTEPEATMPSLVHFGGCNDGRYSYGSKQGGVFTTALFDTWDPAISYAEWFARARKLMPKNQTPSIETTGTPFATRPIFK